MPSNRAISQFSIETLATSPEAVKPRPLPTLGLEDISPLLLPSDWVNSVQFSVSWRTDASSSAASALDNEENIGLLTRPARTLTISFTGRSDSETHALAMMLLNYANSGGPAPLVQDAVQITSTSIESGKLRVFGDFRYGHFFLGQRCVIVSNEIASRSQKTAQWAVIAETNGDSLLFDAVPGRVPAVGESVIPCMDADLVQNSSGTFITDSVLRAKVVFEETAGPETLPATARPARYDNLATVLPYSEEGLPILDLDPDWSDGVSVKVVRKSSSQGVGRSTVSDASGKPFLVFGIDLAVGTKKGAWEILQVFDAFRGRAGSFLFLHPNDPWKFHTTPFSGTSAANIQRVGTRADLESFFNKAAFVKADGRVFVRDISSVQEISGTFFRLNLSSALPDTDFESVVPIHECSFYSDTLETEWKTDSVVLAGLEIREIRNNQQTTITGGYKQLTADFGRFRSIITSANPAVWVEPSVNCFGSIAGVGMTMAGHSFPNQVIRVFDPRESVPSLVPSSFQPRYPFLYPATTPAGRLVTIAEKIVNGGKPVVSGSMWLLSTTNPLQPPLQQEHLWDNNTGWTMILCITPHRSGSRPNMICGPAGVSGWHEGEVIRISSGGQDILNFFFTYGLAQLVSQASLSVIDSAGTTHSSLPWVAPTLEQVQYLTVPDITVGVNKSSVMVIRYDPTAGKIFFHLNGLPMLSGGFFSIPGILTPGSYSGCWLGGGYNVISNISGGGYPSLSQFASAWGTLGAVNAFLSWPRALSSADTNALAKAVSDNYGADWLQVAYP